MDDLLREFLTECRESTARLEMELVRLEREPDDAELIAGVFRLVHTIKGTCGFLDLSRLAAVAHATENVLGRLRDRELVATPEIVTLLLHALDRIKEILDVLAGDPVEPPGDDSALIATLDAAAMPKGISQRPPHDARPPPPAAESLAAQTLRVPVGLLERLGALVDELVLTRNQLLRAVPQGGDPALGPPLQRLDQITGALREGVMRTRMQTIGGTWNKLPRLIRDLARDLGKEITLEMRGAETELDRQVLEMIKDPLTHMVRNAADHGLEAPAERRRRGKPERGTIRLDARHEGGHIIIEVSDDGRGLDTRRIGEKALARGLVTPAELAVMTDDDIREIVFLPGFSTAATVTAVSGRGVGMDVVRTNIEKIGGRVGIRSRPGQGSTFTIRLPHTLAIVTPLILEASGESGCRSHSFPPPPPSG